MKWVCLISRMAANKFLMKCITTTGGKISNICPTVEYLDRRVS
jgi:hypothetical protein